MDCAVNRRQRNSFSRKYSITVWHTHHIASFAAVRAMIQNVRTQRTEGAHLVLNSTVFRHSHTGMDFRRPWQSLTFRCPCCLHRLVCVPVGFTVRIERSLPGAPGSPGGPPPGTPERQAATIPSGGPGAPRDPVQRCVSPEPAGGTAHAEVEPSECRAATVVSLPARGATVVAETTASAPISSSGGMAFPDNSCEPPARRRRFN